MWCLFSKVCLILLTTRVPKIQSAVVFDQKISINNIYLLVELNYQQRLRGIEVARRIL